MSNPWNESPEDRANRTIRETKKTADAISNIGNPNRGGGGGNNGCFPADVSVLTPSGWQNISNLNTNDYVLAFCSKTGKLKPRQIIKRKSYPSSRIWRIRTINEDAPIRTTRSHSFLTKNGWKTTLQLQSQDTLQQVDSSGFVRGNEIIEISKTQKIEPVFNLIIECENTFIVGGCVAHSFTHARSLRHWWYKCLKPLAIHLNGDSIPQPTS